MKSAGILVERESPGAATAIVVGRVGPDCRIDLASFRAVLWLVDAEGRKTPPAITAAATLHVAAIDGSDDAALEAAIAAFLPADPRHLPHVFVTEAVLAHRLGSYECAVELLYRVLERTNRARLTREKDGFTWQKHLLLNLAEFARRRVPANWSGRLRGLPAFVCGAGPSLDASVAALARHADDGVVIAADSALRTLERHGIVADFVISIDAHKRPENCLVPDAEPGRVILSPVSPPCWRETVPADRCYFLSSRQITESWLESLGVARTPVPVTENGGSTGLELARLLGCAPIHLFGLDLAADVADPARRHTADANPASYAGEGAAAFGREPRVPGNYAAELPTYLFSDWQALDARLAEWPPELVVNVNDRGARLRNTTVVHPSQFTCAAAPMSKRVALSHLTLPALDSADAVRAALAAVGAQGAHGCRAGARLRDVLEQRGPSALVVELRTLFATGDFARALGAFSFKLMPHLAPPVREDVEFWTTLLDELEDLCCIAESVYDVSLA